MINQPCPGMQPLAARGTTLRMSQEEAMAIDDDDKRIACAGDSTRGCEHLERMAAHPDEIRALVLDPLSSARHGSVQRPQNAEDENE